MHHGNQVFIGSDFCRNRVDREPCFVLVSDDDADDLFVKFDEFIVFGASDHGDDDDLFDLLLLFCVDCPLGSLPASFDCVFELNEGGLFQCLVDVGVVDYFHQSHTIAYIKEG